MPQRIYFQKAPFKVDRFRQPGYGGPCPPVRDKPHQYTITIYALKTDKLGLDTNATPALVGYILSGNTIGKSSIVAYYQR